MALTVNVPGMVRGPAAVVTLTGPELALGMTSASNVPADWLSGIAAVPPMVTDWVVEKSAPVKLTTVPTGPDEGAKVTGVLELESPLPQAESRVAKPAMAIMAMAARLFRGTRCVTFTRVILYFAHLLVIKLAGSYYL